MKNKENHEEKDEDTKNNQEVTISLLIEEVVQNPYSETSSIQKEKKSAVVLNTKPKD